MTSMEAQPSGLSREALIDAILEFLADQDLLALRDIRAALDGDRDGRAGCLARSQGEASRGQRVGLLPARSTRQRIHHLLADRFLGHGSELRDAHYLAGLTQAPVIIVANHLSDADANVVEVLLQRASGAGGQSSDRLGGPESVHES